MKLKPKETSKNRQAYLIQQEDLFADVEEKKGTTLFLGKYTMQQAGIVMRKRNFVKEAQKRNLWPVKVVIDSTSFPPLQRLQFFYKEAKPENLIVDLKLRESRYSPETELPFEFSFSAFTFLVMEWLTLQNPRMKFSTENTPLPGQNYPGLRLGKKFFDLFEYLARLNKNDGLLAYPAYFHNALLFLRGFYFVNPAKKAEVQAIRSCCSNVPFKELAWIVNLGCLRDKNDEIYEWKAEEMVSPLNRELKAYFSSNAYEDIVKESQEDMSFEIDWDSYKERIKKQRYFS